MAELFRDKTLARKTTPAVPAEEALERRVVGLYFSASWCPPCRQFTPLLREVYEELTARGVPFEVVFISFDKTAEDLQSYVMDDHGDWLFLPFADPLISELKDRFSITAIPQLIIVKPDGDVITPQGRKHVQDRGVSCFTSWSQGMDKA
ncbi:nucleoredoxin-like protein 2 [Acanthaster planci]|uniref:Nucleoredoxin-like protein 2 n=1 Tax=Acanthaster planci TaxID=133434 RepID=A0A8B7Y429_ACAPL|nr:nucleoredoxin-like protein 2 [Acanthaster planci]XP_022087943.1 nucleoredoxin-like protein 2 [Acanthaster planci]XP_022087944.1 nucleoredoxin-like protein 2 [Acanthaster planci]XP_022087945.1 nucleoredoxin-like protein 2 [Acanthaster planci]XP_022087946.1 nucleoredoxin-like protein 2 [Acanthaster planci]XP_022087947.1 nucleoredoxin-like protein 2 [Acanthaster planci]